MVTREGRLSDICTKHNLDVGDQAETDKFLSAYWIIINDPLEPCLNNLGTQIAMRAVEIV
jgi:hypothetical protein